MASLTLKEKAYIELRKAIMNGTLKPGDFLTERTLVEMLGMSRTPIRSALERLDVEGLAKYTPNKGLIVSEISLTQIVEVYDYRVALEGYVVRKLAERSLAPEDAAWFERNLEEQRRWMETNDVAAFTAVDTAFHRKLAEAYGNAEIVRSMERLQDLLYRIALRVLRKDVTRLRVSYEDHRRIFELIAAGRGEEAAEQVEQHLEFGKRILIM